MSKKTVHVTPKGDHWQVKISGNERASATAPTQREALLEGERIAKELKTELVTHRPDGTIRDSDSYGNDPCPPKDKKH